MPPRQRKTRNTSGRTPNRSRNQPRSRRRDEADEPPYGWQNVFGYDNNDGTISGNASFSIDWILSLAMIITGEDYERIDDDFPLIFDSNDDSRIILRFKLRPHNGNCHWVGNVFESDPDTGKESRTSARTRVTQEEFEEEPRRKRGRQGRRDVPRTTSRRQRYNEYSEDEDNYDDNPF